jgi:hypothetical protein
VLDLEIQSRCLLAKWVFHLINTDGKWQHLIQDKYLGNKSITQVNRNPRDS